MVEELHMKNATLNPEIRFSSFNNWQGCQSPLLFDFDAANRFLNQQLGTKDLNAFGCTSAHTICAAIAIR